MAELMRLHDAIMALETDDGFGWEDVCERNAFGHCTVGGVMAFYSSSAAGVDRHGGVMSICTVNSCPYRKSPYK
jgi:hypothetical protein